MSARQTVYLHSKLQLLSNPLFAALESSFVDVHS